MSLDLLDAAFVRRLAVREAVGARAERVRPAPRPARPEPHPTRAEPRPRSPAPPPAAPQPIVTSKPTVADAVPQPLRPVGAAPTDAAPERERVDAALVEPIGGGSHAALRPGEDPIVARLLSRAPEEWDALARHCEAARQRGRRVIAVAGGRAGEGRTTLVRCLAETLRARGRDVACADPADLAAVAAGPDGRGPTHDKRIVLVDAGVWFPPGPIRRSRLQVACLGCEAAILVRRAGASGGLSRQAALEALGIEVLGEVLTFTAPDGATGTLQGDTAA